MESDVCWLPVVRGSEYYWKACPVCAQLHKHGTHVVFKRPRHSDLDVLFFNNNLDEYDCLNNIDFSNRMKVCRQNPKVKTSPIREFNAAFELLR